MSLGIWPLLWKKFLHFQYTLWALRPPQMRIASRSETEFIPALPKTVIFAHERHIHILTHHVVIPMQTFALTEVNLHTYQP